MSKEENAARIITGEVRISYPRLFEPYAMEEGQDKKYQCSFIVDAKDDVTLARIKSAVAAAKEKGIKEVWGGKTPKNLKMPIRDGNTDESAEGKDYMVDKYFFNATSKQKPGTVINKRVGGKFVEACEEDLYPGCYVVASLTFYPFDTNGSKGIAVAINNIIKTNEGENLAGSVDPNDEFADLDIDSEFASKEVLDITDEDLPF